MPPPHHDPRHPGDGLRSAPSNETIYAVSSPPGRSARGLLRLSGPQAFELLDRLCVEPVSGPPRTMLQGRIVWDEPVAEAPLSLPALIAKFLAPASYTGQDSVEIQLPGNPFILERLQRRLSELGGRPAEPGEFTFRTFLAGKLDLTQAEGIAASINAVSEAQLQAATMLRQGHLGQLAESLVDRLGSLLALIEAGIDFIDQEDVTPISPADLLAGLEGAFTEILTLLQRSRRWASLDDQPRIVLAGPPSSGKSTLFNALLGQSRAVVHRKAGTTRDLLMEPLRLSDEHGRSIEVLLVDLAGLDEPHTALDREAQRAARQAIDRADLRLSIRDDDRPHAPLPGSAPVLRVRTKADRAAIGTSASGSAAYDLCLSAHTGQGLDELRRHIVARLGQRAVSLGGESLALQRRHRAALEEAAAQLQGAIDELRPEVEAGSANLVNAELLAGLIRAALDALASLGGRMSPDDIIGRVFATFCCGK